MAPKPKVSAVAPGPDNFEFALIDKFAGYNSAIDPTTAPANTLIRGSLNVYRKVSGTIANRPGKKIYDATTDSTVAGCLSGFVWDTSLGTTYPLRVANSKLQVESSITGTRVWYDLMTALTKTRFVFDTWWDNTDKKDVLLMCNGTGGTLYDWAGGFSLFVSAIASTSITLSTDPATAGFASSGTVTINGNDYPYTGIDSATKKLTGVTGDASSEAANSVVMSKIGTHSSLTSGPGSGYAIDFIKSVNNQVYAGSYTSQELFISKNTSYTDYSFSSPRVTGEGEFVLLDAPMNGIGANSGGAKVFAGDSLVYEIGFNQITVGTTLSEQTTVTKIDLGGKISAYAHEMIDTLADNIIYLDQSQQLRSFGNFRNLFVAKSVLLSTAVADELNEETFTNGQLKAISDRRGDLVYITAPSSGKVYIYQERSSLDSVGNVVAERLWQPPQVWSVSRIATISGSVVGFSNENPQIYYLWDTNQWHDDIPSGMAAYSSTALFAYQNGGRRQGKIEFDKVYYEGYASDGSKLYGAVYYDYEGFTGLASVILNTTDDPFPVFFTGLVPPSLGDASLGDNPLGDGLNILPNDQALLPKYRVAKDFQVQSVFEFALMVYSADIDSRWELLAIGANIHESEFSGVEIRK